MFERHRQTPSCRCTLANTCTRDVFIPLAADLLLSESAVTAGRAMLCWTLTASSTFPVALKWRSGTAEGDGRLDY